MFLIVVNSLGPSDAIWQWRSWSTLVQVMACCHQATSHYLNQCWLIISKVLWHSSEEIIIRRFGDTNQQSKIEDYIFKIISRSPRGQWVKLLWPSDTIVSAEASLFFIKSLKNIFFKIVITYPRCQWVKMADEILQNFLALQELMLYIVPQ